MKKTTSIPALLLAAVLGCTLLPGCAVSAALEPAGALSPGEPAHPIDGAMMRAAKSRAAPRTARRKIRFIGKRALTLTKVASRQDFPNGGKHF